MALPSLARKYMQSTVALTSTPQYAMLKPKFLKLTELKLNELKLNDLKPSFRIRIRMPYADRRVGDTNHELAESAHVVEFHCFYDPLL